MKGFTKGKGKGRKFIPTSRKKQALSSQDIKKTNFGISPQGTIGLKTRKPKEVLKFNKQTKELERIHNEIEKAIKSNDWEELNKAFEFSMTQYYQNGEEPDDYDIPDKNDKLPLSKLGWVAENILDTDVWSITKDNGFDQHEVFGNINSIRSVESQLGNFWYDHQADEEAQKEELIEQNEVIQRTIDYMKEITEGF